MNTQELPAGPFDILLADPPWRYDHRPIQRKGVDDHYPTMDDDEICQLEVESICADSAVLFLWATVPRLPASLRVMEAWGFAYKSAFVWVKPHIGFGYWVRGRHEHLLLGVKGKAKPPRTGLRQPSVIQAPRRDHSRKPDEVYSIIEKMFPDATKCELFARRTRCGWTAWGNEAQDHALL